MLVVRQKMFITVNALQCFDFLLQKFAKKPE